MEAFPRACSSSSSEAAFQCVEEGWDVDACDDPVANFDAWAKKTLPGSFPKVKAHPNPKDYEYNILGKSIHSPG